MKNKSYLLCAVALFVSAACFGESANISIGTFNIKCAQTPDANNWAQRSDSVKRLVRFHDFDVIGTQEGWLHQLDDIKSDDSIYEYVADPREDGEQKGETCAIFYKPSKYDLLLNGRFWLSETPSKPSMGWDARHKRICTWVKLRDKASKKIFFVFNVHLDNLGARARANSARLLVEKIKSTAGKDPFFLVGDFNSSPSSEAILYLTTKGFIDAKNASRTPPYGPKETWHNYTCAPVEKQPDRIDCILVSPGIEIERYGVLTDRLCDLIKDDSIFGANANSKGARWSNIRTPSDHYPVLVKAVIK